MNNDKNSNVFHITELNKDCFVNNKSNYKKNKEESNSKEYLNIDNLSNFSSYGKIHVHDTVTIGAETGYGKTALAVNIANSCLKAYNVIYVNLDSNNIDIQERLIAQATKCNIDDITDDIADRYYDEILEDCKTLMFLNDTKLDSVIKFIEDICSILKEQAVAQPIVVIIDTINNIDTRKNSSYENLKEVSKALRSLTRKTNIIMFNLAQLNRASKKAEKSIIDCDVHSFTDASDIENDSTQVILFGEKEGKDILVFKKNRYNSDSINKHIQVDYNRTNQVIKEIDNNAAAETPRRTEKTPPKVRRK